MTISTLYELIFITLFSAYAYLLYDTAKKSENALSRAVHLSYLFIREQVARLPNSPASKMLHAPEYANAAAMFRNTTPEQLTATLHPLLKATLFTQVFFGILSLLLASIVLHHNNPFPQWIYICANITMFVAVLNAYKIHKALKLNDILSLRIRAGYHHTINPTSELPFLLLGITYVLEAAQTLQNIRPAPSSESISRAKQEMTTTLQRLRSFRNIVGFSTGLSESEQQTISELLIEYEDLLSALVVTECTVLLHSDRISDDQFETCYHLLFRELLDTSTTTHNS